MGWRQRLIRFDAWLSAKPAAVELALKTRNHCNLVIADALTAKRDSDPRTNGEALLCLETAPGSARFVDVGANVGAWTSLFLEHAPADCRGLLFEPGVACARELRRRFSAHDRVEVVEAALSDESAPESLPFYEGEDSWAASLVPSADGAATREVRVTNLAAELTARGWDHVDVVKIDAEGYDLRVLRGSRPYLERHAIDIVQFEYGRGWWKIRTSLAEAFNLLESLGYEVFRLERSGLSAFDYSRWGETFAYMNFAAFTPPGRARVGALIGRASAG